MVARWSVTVAAMALLVLTVPAATRSAVSHAAPRTCSSGQVRIALRHLGAALGTVGGYVSFRNVSGVTCWLKGWPELIAYTAAAKATVAVRRHSTMFGPDVRGVPVVTLRPGQRAEAVFTGSDVNSRSSTRLCPSFQFFRVGLPGHSATTRVSAWITGLGAYMPNCSGISLSMVVPARSLYQG